MVPVNTNILGMMKLDVLPESLDSGEAKLSVHTTGTGDIRLWTTKDHQSGTILLDSDSGIMQDSWSLATETVPDTVYVEGINPSSEPCDISLVLKFEYEENGKELVTATTQKVTVVECDEDTVNKVCPDYKYAMTIDPINTINGDVTASDTDLAVQCKGLSLLMKRYYNSRSEYTNSPVGARWNHSFDWQLQERTNYYYRGIQTDWLVLRTGNGQQKWFEHITNEYYKAPVGLDWRLIRNADDTCAMATDGGVNVWSFDSDGSLLSISNIFNDSLTFSYSGDELSRIEHSDGQFFDYQYNGDGLISRVNTSTNALYVTYTYSDAGNLTNVVRHVGDREYVTSYKYGILQSLTNRCNALGQNFAYEYVYTNNSDGISIAKGSGMSVEDYWYEHTLDYNTASNYTIVTYPLRGTNQTFRYKYAPDTLVITDIYGPGSESNHTEYVRDGQSDLVKIKTTDSETGDYFISSMSYDINHNLTSTAVGYNAEPLYTWNYFWNLTNNTLLAAIDPEEHEVSYEYNGLLPWKTHIWLSDDESITSIVEHNSKGLLTKAINPNGHWVEFAYNDYGFPTSAIPQIGPAVYSKVNEYGFIEEVSSPWTNDTLRSTIVQSDLIGNITNIIYADGTSESFAYDNMNNLVSYIDVNGTSNEYVYAPTHKLTAVIRSTGSIAATNYYAITNSFDYDQQFNSLFLTDALNRPVESYVMDIKDRPIAVTNVEGQVMSINYGVGSMIKSVERFDGTIVSNSYDSSARLTQTVVGSLTNRFSYYKNALVAKVETENGYVTNIYDNANRFVSGICCADGLETTTDYMLDYGGNATNAVISLGSTNITTLSAEFDEGERISQFTSVASGADRRITNAFVFAYNEISGLTSQVTNENSGIFVEYDFDIMDQLKSIVWKDASNSVIRSFDYSYSHSGMITNITRETSSENINYTYSDFFGTLRKSSSSYYTAQYVTDVVGNPVEYVINGSYFYNFGFDAGNRLSSWMGGGYKYNIAGCVTNKTGGGISTDIGWNDRYQMTSVSTNGTLAKSYTFDSLGRRSSITDANGNVTKIIYDGMHMVADVDENGDVLRTYTVGPGIDNWLSFTDHQTSNTYYYITDHLGTVHAVTDSSGVVVESYRYSPYGKVLAIFDENGNTIPKTKIGNRILFQGREYDWDTGFYYFRARWYDPDTGRWLSKDPIGISGGLNQYVFCGNNPVMLVDPLGLCEDDDSLLSKLGQFGNPYDIPSFKGCDSLPRYKQEDTRDLCGTQLLFDAFEEDYGVLNSAANKSGMAGSITLTTYRRFGAGNISYYTVMQVRPTGQHSIVGDELYDWMEITDKQEADTILQAKPKLMQRAIDANKTSKWQRFWETVESLFL